MCQNSWNLIKKFKIRNKYLCLNLERLERYSTNFFVYYYYSIQSKASNEGIIAYIYDWTNQTQNKL